VNDDRVALAAVAGAHGIGGEVRLKLFAEGVDSLKRHKQVRAGDRVLTLASVRAGKQPIARFAEVVDRSAAEALRGTLLTVAKAELPPLEEGEYYHADLIGLPCVSPAGEALGIVVAVENFGAGDLIEVKPPLGGTTFMLPFTEAVVPVVDVAGGRIVVEPPPGTFTDDSAARED
jgi:16S rRNA processing protein RimM